MKVNKNEAKRRMYMEWLKTGDLFIFPSNPDEIFMKINDKDGFLFNVNEDYACISLNTGELTLKNYMSSHEVIKVTGTLMVE